MKEPDAREQRKRFIDAELETERPAEIRLMQRSGAAADHPSINKSRREDELVLTLDIQAEHDRQRKREKMAELACAEDRIPVEAGIDRQLESLVARSRIDQLNLRVGAGTEDRDLRRPCAAQP